MENALPHEALPRRGKIAIGLARKFMSWKIKSKRKALAKFVDKFAKKGDVNQGFFNFARDFLKKGDKYKFWKTVLGRSDLLPFQIYDVSTLVDDEESRMLARRKFLKEASFEELCETLAWVSDDYLEEVFKRTCEHIRCGRVKRSRVWKLLIDMIKNNHMPPDYREDALELLMCYDPPDDELRRVVDLPISRSDLVLSELQQKILVFIRKRKNKKDTNNTFFDKIKKTSEAIEQLKRQL